MKPFNRLIIMLLLVVSHVTLANPFIPQYDDEIIERLPEQLFQSANKKSAIKTLRDQVQSQPNNWLLASELAQHYINLAQSQADPRYMGYAEAILQPWWQTQPPPIAALIMRAVIRQNAHDFNAANTDLETVLSLQPRHQQANLIRATIATVQGQYPIAIQHCRQLMRRSSSLLALVCQSIPASLSGKAEGSYRVLQQILSRTTALPDKQQLWAQTALAEIAWRLGEFKEAEQYFQSALATGVRDYYLFRVYADFLLQQQRPAELIALFANDTANDSLLLRVALANQLLGSTAQLNQQIALLQRRYTANRRRGSSLHQGDEARFRLHLLHQAQAALALARQNWQKQREPADTYILLQTAIAANNNAAIDETIAWLQEHNNDDVLIQEILATRVTSDHVS